jgi:uncharacterized protein
MTPQEQLARQIATLEELAAVDATIRKLDTQIAESESQLSGLRSELARLEAKLAESRSSASDMQKTMSESVQEARQLTTQVERSREKMARVRNERETMATQRELEELRKLLRDREEEIGKLTALSDVARRTIEETEAQRVKVAAELAENEAALSSGIESVVGERETKLATRAALASKVANLTMRRYEAVRLKRGTALAPVRDGTCLACHIAIPPQLFHKLQRREVLEQCPSCARILYWTPSVKPGDDAEKAENGESQA